MKKYKLAFFVSHPIQYQVPLFKLLSQEKQIVFKVFYLCDISLRTYKDHGFGHSIKWDIPLLEGYNYEFLKCKLKNNTFSLFNPLVFGIKAALKQQKWDAVWFHGYNNHALLWGIYSAVRLKIPFFFRSESNLCSTSKSFLKDLFIRYLVKKASALLYVSSDNKDYYNYYGATEKKLFFTPYAVDNKFFQEKVELSKNNLQELKKAIGLKNSKYPIILFASKFIKRKNATLLLEAFANLSKDKKIPPKAYLLFIGDGEERTNLENRINCLGWQENIKLLGFKNQSELPAYFALCDIFVLPSSKEPFGLVINEAMNAGKVIITTNEVGCAADLVKDGQNGFITKAEDLNSLGVAIRKCSLMNKNQLQKMGQESLKIINKWSYKEDVKGILEALDSINEF